MVSSQDAAWVNVDTTLTQAQLFEFIMNAERLFRLNPYLDAQVWQSDQRCVTEGVRIHLKYLN